ncbi:hypothetical protein F4861DRAFT_538598 [Xylaria intraflava]|nr:hypothetical protein F4861DRAFT_538598 [Xylaria intraflava]
MPSVQDIPQYSSLDPSSLDLDYRPAIFHSTSWLTGLTSVAVILRFCSRRVAHQKIAIDDWLVLGALVLEYIVFAIQTEMTVNGIGRSTLAVITMPNALQHLDAIVKGAYALIPLIATALACMKLSVLALYRRVFLSRMIRIGVYSIGTVVVMWWIAALPPFSTGSTITGFVIDVAILALPVRDILQLKMSLWQRLALVGLFSLGSLSAVAGWIRWAILESYFNDPTTDILSAYGLPSIIIILEMCVGIIGVSLTTISPLIKAILRHFGYAGSSKTQGEHKHDLPEIVTIGGSGQPKRLPGSSSEEHTSSSERACSLPQYPRSASPENV